MENVSIEQYIVDNNLKIPEADLILQLLTYLSCAVIVFGNCLTIVSVVKFRWLRNNTNILICSLSCADLYVGVSSFVYQLSLKFKTNSDNKFIITYTLLRVGYISSVLHLATVAIERFIGVNYPLRYHSLVTSRRIMILIATAWGISLFHGMVSITVLFIHGTDVFLYIDPINISFYFISGLVIGIVYLTMLPTIQRQAKAIRQQLPNEATQARQEMKASVTLGFLLMAYIICWTPYFVITILMHTSESEVTSTEYTLWVFSMFLSTLNSALNFFIYAWTSKEYRRAYVTLLTCHRKERRIEEISHKP